MLILPFHLIAGIPAFYLNFLSIFIAIFILNFLKPTLFSFG